MINRIILSNFWFPLIKICHPFKLGIGMISSYSNFARCAAFLCLTGLKVSHLLVQAQSVSDFSTLISL